MQLPYLTAQLPGIGGQIKVKPEDFFVEELPLYAPSGEGQHLYVVIEKSGLSTFAAVRKIARLLDISPANIGYAGLKDAKAITRQTLSISNVSPQAIETLQIPNIKILNVARHSNKLRTGHLAGNRFVIRVRGVSPDSETAASAILSVLTKRGVPNYFGQQRFGNRGNTGRLGELLLRDDTTEFLAEFLGRPQTHETPQVQAARQLVDEGKWAEALAQWPRYLSDEQRVLAAYQKSGQQPDVVFKAINKKLKGLFISAFQSSLFNTLLMERLEQIDSIEDGDVAYIHGKGACFIVEDSALEQPRVDNFEISSAGPMFGSKTLMAEEQPGQKERELLAKYNLTLDQFKLPGLKIRGTRRPYRIRLGDAKMWWDDGLMVSFELPPGSYATTVMAEVMKNRL